MSTSLDQSFRIDPAELPGQTVIFGGTPTMREIHSRIDSVLSVDLPVLIQGESGTGKELIARFLHARSSRRDAPFVKLNCSAIPANLLESELFGSLKGASGFYSREPITRPAHPGRSAGGWLAPCISTVRRHM